MLFGDAIVFLEHRGAVAVGELDRAEIDERLLHRGPHRPMSRTVGTMRLNRRARNFVVASALIVERLEALLDVEAGRFPGLDRLEPVAHQVAGLDQEFLALVALLLGQLRIVVAQGEAAEGDVARSRPA